MCRKKSLFDNKQAEIQELTYIIKQDINSLNGQIAQLQQLARQQRGQTGKHQQSHSNSVVLSLQVLVYHVYNIICTVSSGSCFSCKETAADRTALQCHVVQLCVQPEHN